MKKDLRFYTHSILDKLQCFVCVQYGMYVVMGIELKIFYSQTSLAVILEDNLVF